VREDQPVRSVMSLIMFKCSNLWDTAVKNSGQFMCGLTMPGSTISILTLLEFGQRRK